MELSTRRDTPITPSVSRTAAARRRATDAHLGAVLRELSARPRALRAARRLPPAVIAARPAQVARPR